MEYKIVFFIASTIVFSTIVDIVPAIILAVISTLISNRLGKYFSDKK